MNHNPKGQQDNVSRSPDVTGQVIFGIFCCYSANTSKKIQAEHTSKKSRRERTPLNKGRAQRARRGLSNAELVKRALLLPRLLPPAPDLPHLHRLFAVAYREDHGPIWTKAALADGTRVRGDADKAAAGGECVDADRVGIRGRGRLGHVRKALACVPREAMSAQQFPRVR